MAPLSADSSSSHERSHGGFCQKWLIPSLVAPLAVYREVKNYQQAKKSGEENLPSPSKLVGRSAKLLALYASYALLTEHVSDNYFFLRSNEFFEVSLDQFPQKARLRVLYVQFKMQDGPGAISASSARAEVAERFKDSQVDQRIINDSQDFFDFLGNLSMVNEPYDVILLSAHGYPGLIGIGADNYIVGETLRNYRSDFKPNLRGISHSKTLLVVLSCGVASDRKEHQFSGTELAMELQKIFQQNGGKAFLSPRSIVGHSADEFTLCQYASGLGVIARIPALAGLWAYNTSGSFEPKFRVFQYTPGSESEFQVQELW